MCEFMLPCVCKLTVACYPTKIFFTFTFVSINKIVVNNTGASVLARVWLTLVIVSFCLR